MIWTATFYIHFLFSLSFLAAAEPVQYCKDGSRGNINFCMGLTVHKNITSKSEDIYLSFTQKRYDGSDLGWTAIGTGSEMLGSLMFVVYGDPLGNGDPIVSIRGTTGHVQPQLIQKELSGGLDIRVLRSQWIPTSSHHQSFTPDQPIYEGRVSIVCYSCGLWSGSKLDVLSSAQPWIWAWNEHQKFSTFSYDAHLLMHKHHAGAGGWGNFYLDMPRATAENPGLPSLPPIRSGIAMVGASESATGTSKIGVALGFFTRPELHLHGILGAIGFLAIFPVGVVAIRSGSLRSFKYHWIIQIVASLLTVAAGLAGLGLRNRVSTYHQIQGIVIVAIIPLQSLAGWLHHVKFPKLGRTWISHAHIWLGRILMAAGAVNVVTGLRLKGYSTLVIVAVAVFSCLEFLGLAIFLWWRFTQKRRLEAEETSRAYFSVAGDDSEEDEEK
ncbi:hypothetical protein WAI453_000611 [Rhynchosporium graminicola]|uniref:Cytochrome b561 domain-containing protein n=1 Tax=Rhynchosporium graminicola TaxID=2792576 RepID=A0A1E1JRB6_9HELO|nr:uncharacterized protein RCO7_01154 [Rhynchosporium commune]